MQWRKRSPLKSYRAAKFTTSRRSFCDLGAWRKRQDAEKTPQETLKRRRRCFRLATCIESKKAESALGKAASQVRHISNTRVPNSKAAEGGHRGGFALSPIRAAFSDGVRRVVETRSEVSAANFTFVPVRAAFPARAEGRSSPTNGRSTEAIWDQLDYSGQ